MAKQHIEWKNFDWKLGLRGAVAVLMGAILSHLFDLPGITALSALFVSLSDPPGNLWVKLKVMGIWTLAAVVLTIIALIIGTDMWSMAVSVTLVAFICAAALYYGAKYAILGLLLNYWYIIILEKPDPPIPEKIIGVLAGALLAMAAVALFTILKIHAKKYTVTSPKPRQSIDIHKPGSFWKSPVFKFALIKACAVGVAAVLGWVLVGERPFWVVFAPLSIIKPDLHQTAIKGLKRIGGTIAGGIIGVLLIGNIQNDILLSLLLVVLTFLFIGTVRISYTMMISWLTLILIVAGRLAGVSAMFSGVERIIATILGVVIAFSVIIIIWLFMKGKTAHNKAQSYLKV